MAELETVRYEETGDGVAWVTLDRPEVHNAFDTTMQRELRGLWRWLRHRDEVRAILLTGAGDRAFCTGVDQSEVMASPGAQRAHSAAGAHGEGGEGSGAAGGGEGAVAEAEGGAGAGAARGAGEPGPVEFQHEPVSIG